MRPAEYQVIGRVSVSLDIGQARPEFGQIQCRIPIFGARRIFGCSMSCVFAEYQVIDRVSVSLDIGQARPEFGQIQCRIPIFWHKAPSSVSFENKFKDPCVPEMTKMTKVVQKWPT